MRPAIYDFLLFRCLTSKMAAMRQIRTTGQCLLAHFQNGLSSVVNRRTNSLKRSITSPTGKFRSGIRYGVVNWSDKKQESCKVCKGRILQKKAGLYAISISRPANKFVIGPVKSMNMQFMEGNLDASDGFWR
jgi:hypothetical protein